MKSLDGKIQTVTGLVGPEEVGVTMPVEHLLSDPTIHWTPPTEAFAREVFFAPISNESIAFARYYGLKNETLGRLGNIDDAIAEMELFKQWGGGSLVDATGGAGGRDPVGLARIARATDINVVMTASPPQPIGDDASSPRTERDMADEIVTEITFGVDGTGVRAGTISNDRGDGRSLDDPLVLRACGLAHLATGAPLFVRPGTHETAPLAALEILTEMGVEHSRVTFAQMGRYPRSVVKRIAESGCRLVFDGFGLGARAVSDYSRNNSGSTHSESWPKDDQMIDTIAWLASLGHTGQLLASLNIGSADRYLKYGGHGYFYLLANIVPRMRAKGLKEDLIDRLTVRNPAEALVFSPANGE